MGTGRAVMRLAGPVWRAYWARRQRQRDQHDGIFRALGDAQEADGYAVVTSSLGYLVFTVARARAVTGGPAGLESIARRLYEDDWGPRPSDETFSQDDDWYVVGFRREDPTGMPSHEWLWLHDEPEQLGWRKQFIEVLQGRRDELGQPELAVGPAAVEALLRDYDSGGRWLARWIHPSPGIPVVKRIGDHDVFSWDEWFARGVELLGPPAIGRVWYGSTIKALLDAHRPGWEVLPPE